MIQKGGGEVTRLEDNTKTVEKFLKTLSADYYIIMTDLGEVKNVTDALKKKVEIVRKLNAPTCTSEGILLV